MAVELEEEMVESEKAKEKIKQRAGSHTVLVLFQSHFLSLRNNTVKRVVRTVR